MKQKFQVWLQNSVKNIKPNIKILGILFATLSTCVVICFIFLRTDTDIKQATQELANLNQNIRRYYQNRPDFWGLSTAKIIDSGIYPQNMLQNGKLIGFCGNEILVGRGEKAEMLMPGSRGFDIVYKNLTEKQCIALASFEYTEDFWLGIAGITIGNSVKKSYFTWSDKENTLPIQKKIAKNICREKNFLVWHYE